MNHLWNNTSIDQLWRLNENIEEVMGMSFPEDIPVLKLVASGTAKGKSTGDDYQNAHIERLGQNAQWKIIEGTHFLYHGHVEEICNATNEFLK